MPSNAVQGPLPTTLASQPSYAGHPHSNRLHSQAQLRLGAVGVDDDHIAHLACASRNSRTEHGIVGRVQQAKMTATNLQNASCCKVQLLQLTWWVNMDIQPASGSPQYACNGGQQRDEASLQKRC